MFAGVECEGTVEKVKKRSRSGLGRRQSIHRRRRHESEETVIENEPKVKGDKTESQDALTQIVF